LSDLPNPAAGKGERKLALFDFPFHTEKNHTNQIEGNQQKIMSRGKENSENNKLKSCETHQHLRNKYVFESLHSPKMGRKNIVQNKPLENTLI